MPVTTHTVVITLLNNGTVLLEPKRLKVGLGDLIAWFLLEEAGGNPTGTLRFQPRWKGDFVFSPLPVQAVALAPSSIPMPVIQTGKAFYRYTLKARNSQGKLYVIDPEIDPTGVINFLIREDIGSTRASESNTNVVTATITAVDSSTVTQTPSPLQVKIGQFVQWRCKQVIQGEETSVAFAMKLDPTKTPFQDYSGNPIDFIEGQKADGEDDGGTSPMAPIGPANTYYFDVTTFPDDGTSITGKLQFTVVP